MINNLFQKVIVSTAVGTVIGFSTILGAMNSASALTIDSPSVNRRGNTQDISNIVLYLKDNSGTISKVKIDSVSGTTSYDATNFLEQEYPDSEVVAYTVKAGNNKSGMGPGEGELFVLNEQFDENNLPRSAADETYQYSQVSQIQPKQEESTPNQPEDTTPTNEEPSSPEPKRKFLVTAPPQTNSSTEPVSVPEPGSIAAIAIFGLSGLLGKNKISS